MNKIFKKEIYYYFIILKKAKLY